MSTAVQSPHVEAAPKVADSATGHTLQVEEMGAGGGGETRTGRAWWEAICVSLGELLIGLAAATATIAAAVRVTTGSGTQVHTGATAHWGVDEEQGAGGPDQTNDTDRE